MTGEGRWSTWRPFTGFSIGSWVVVPDDLADDQLDPVTAWRLRKEAAVRADIVPYHASDFARDRDTPNTIAYESAREGLLLYER